MNASERFFRVLDKMAGRCKNSGLEVTVEAVGGAFGDAMGGVPQGLCQSVYLRFLDSFNKSGKAGGEFIAAAYSLGPWIDLFWCEYDEESSAFTSADWDFLKEEVCACAGEMDMDIVTYIMRQLMSRGKI